MLLLKENVVSNGFDDKDAVKVKLKTGKYTSTRASKGSGFVQLATSDHLLPELPESNNRPVWL